MAEKPAPAKRSASISTNLKFRPWQQLQPEGSPPSPRYGLACVLVGDRLYAFGGASSEGDDIIYHNDMHVLNLGESLSWELVDQQGDTPTPREGASLSLIGGELFLYGGTSSESEATLECAGGLHVFETESHSWSRRETSGSAPRAQSLSVILSDTQLVTFGGVLKGKAVNDVHLLDTATLEWTLAETTGTPPAPRCDQGCVVVGRNMYLVGGSGRDDLWFNDSYVLNLDSLEWQAVDAKGSLPRPRDYPTFSNLSNWYLLLMGGFGGSPLGDLHFIDITNKSPVWCEVGFDEQESTPPPRFGHSAFIYAKKLFVVGGQDNDNEMNDVWCTEAILPTPSFNATPVPRTRYNSATPIPAPRKTVTPTPPKVVKPRDFEELRSTYLKRINEMFDTLAEKFLQLDTATEVLAAERSAFEAEKKDHNELYDQQQQELKEMLDSHRAQNEGWIEEMRVENDSDRKALAEERARLEKEGAELVSEQETFQQKSQKLDAIMRQVQGLNN